jgi:hypothetical protein
VPDLHHFRGSFGGKDVIPLWRTASTGEPNVTAGLLAVLSREFGASVSPEDLFAYAYAILASPDYGDRFAEELTTPGPRLPVTRDSTMFEEAASIGRRLVWLHTYGARFVPDGHRTGVVPQGSARALVPVPDTASGYPEQFSYDEVAQAVHVGAGSFGPVAPEVWLFSVSGYEVVKAWLACRMRGGSGRRSSSLDDIRPDRWTPAFTQEFLELLWVLEQTVATFPALATVLGSIVAGPTFLAADLPMPDEAERLAPAESKSVAHDGQSSLGLD